MEFIKPTGAQVDLDPTGTGTWYPDPVFTSTNAAL